MSEFKGTPGPWRWDDGHFDGEKLQLVGTLDTGPVAVIWPGEEADYINVRLPEDANLIAAAPDLLEALQGLLEYHRPGDSLDQAGKWQEAAEAAIAKAMGEQP